MSGTKETTVDVKTVCGACGEVAVKAVDEKGVAAHGGLTTHSGSDGMRPLPGKPMAQWMDPDNAGFTKKRRSAKKRRLRALGAQPASWSGGKSAELDIDEKSDNDDPFVLCSGDRLLHSADGAKCEFCPEGDHAVKDALDLLGAEGLTEELFEGSEVLDSAYSAKNDVFVVQAKVDESMFEAIWGAKSGDFMGWVAVKVDDTPRIKELEAVDLALKSIEGEAGEVVVGDWNGEDVWSVAIDGADGQAYDAFVSFDGKVLGWDVYETEAKSADDDDAELEPEGEPAKADEPAVEDEPVVEGVSGEKTIVIEDPDLLADLALLKSLDV